jgi:chromosome segregation ATPase
MAMDPFSIVVGTCSVVDISTRVVRYLRSVKESIAGTKDELESLEHEINSIRSISESIRDSFKDEVENCAGKSLADPTKAEALWKNIGNTLRRCERRLSDLADVIQHVTGENNKENRKGSKDNKYTATLEGWKLQLRKLPKNSKIEQIQNDLVGYKGTLGLSLTLIGV